jgi:hypothetical protein
MVKIESRIRNQGGEVVMSLVSLVIYLKRSSLTPEGRSRS